MAWKLASQFAIHWRCLDGQQPSSTTYRPPGHRAVSHIWIVVGNIPMSEWVSSFLTALQHNIGYIVPYMTEWQAVIARQRLVTLNGCLESDKEDDHCDHYVKNKNIKHVVYSYYTVIEHKHFLRSTCIFHYAFIVLNYFNDPYSVVFCAFRPECVISGRLTVIEKVQFNFYFTYFQDVYSIDYFKA